MNQKEFAKSAEIIEGWCQLRGNHSGHASTLATRAGAARHSGHALLTERPQRVPNPYPKMRPT